MSYEYKPRPLLRPSAPSATSASTRARDRHVDRAADGLGDVQPDEAQQRPQAERTAAESLDGFIQGYNAQAVTTEDQVVIAAEVMVASPDFGHLEPMLNAARGELEAAGVTGEPEVVLADAGYWHHEQMQAISDRGIELLIPPDSSRRKGARQGWEGGAYAARASGWRPSAAPSFTANASR